MMQIFSLSVIVPILLTSTCSWAAPPASASTSDIAPLSFAPDPNTTPAPDPNTTPTPLMSDAGRALQRNVIDTTDQIVFKYSLDEFVRASNAQQPPNLIWDIQSCTGGDNRAANFNFRYACQRLDFGLRNYKFQARLTKANGRSLGHRFHHDMRTICGLLTTTWVKGSKDRCREWSHRYYRQARKIIHGMATDKIQCHSHCD